jgi:hypothetical protein
LSPGRACSSNRPCKDMSAVIESAEAGAVRPRLGPVLGKPEKTVDHAAPIKRGF